MSGSPLLCGQKDRVSNNVRANGRKTESLVSLLPLLVLPLFPASAAGKDGNGEEDCCGKGSQDDNNDRHGVSWRRCGHGRDRRWLTGAWWLWFHH